MRKSILLTTALSLSLFAAAAQADERACLDAHCFQQSLSALDALGLNGDTLTGGDTGSDSTVADLRHLGL